MAGPARRHHLVSKFYLRHFADGNDMITTVFLPGDRSIVQNIGNASVQNNFYTGIGHNGQETDAAEQAFSLIEAPAADAWEKIGAGVWPLPDTEREAVAGWVGLHLLRGGGNRSQMSELGTDMLNLEILSGGRARLRKVLREEGMPHDDASVDREWIDLVADPLRVEAHPNHHLDYIAQMLPRVTAMLLDRWWVLTSFQRRAIVTSDHPACVVPNKRNTVLGLGTGIANADEIVVPVTRRHSLAMALRASLPQPTPTTDVHHAGVTAYSLYSNSCTVNNARRMVFHHPQDDPLHGLTLPQPRTSEVGKVDLWRFIPDADRHVLIDAGLAPPGENEASE
jgi:Protein of unknown function (DUF4238)